MMHTSPYLLRIAIGVAFVVGVAVLVYLFILLERAGAKSPTQSYIDKKLAREANVYNELKFNLADTGEAPKALRSLARLGYQIMIDTQKYASGYAGNNLKCTNCHIAGGNTTGGSQGGISLVGVATKYPAYDAGRFKSVIDLPARINNCFERSMNGKALPLDSPLMLALVTYFHWISKDLPIYQKIPWLGLKYLTTKHKGDSVQGKRVYSVFCALCHRDDGEGGQDIPPVWGKNSFNNEAGFNRESMLASFIYWNMPYIDSTPVLTEDQAMDVAAYILSQPRPQVKTNK